MKKKFFTNLWLTFHSWSPICTGRQSAASTLYGVMIIKDNMANMCAKVTSIYMEFTLAFGPKPEFSFSFKSLFPNSRSPPLYLII